MKEYAFPVTLIVLNIGCGVAKLLAGEPKLAVYWFGCALCNTMLTLK